MPNRFLWECLYIVYEYYSFLWACEVHLSHSAVPNMSSCSWEFPSVDIYAQLLFHMPLYDHHTRFISHFSVCDNVIYSISNKTRTMMDVFPFSLFQSHLECWPFSLINWQYSVLHNVINQSISLCYKNWWNKRAEVLLICY